MFHDLIDLLPLFMLGALCFLIFTGFPVGFVLGGVGFAFGLIGIQLEVFSFIEFYNLVPRVWGGAAENLILVAVPMFIFMGIMLERSGAAENLLYSLQLLLRRIPGGLALSVTLLGTILAAATGIIGASVVMLSVLALPVMIARGYSKELSTGTVAAAGVLGILIPPSIMLVIMADLLSISVGRLFYGALVPGLLLSGLYSLYIIVYSYLCPSSAPPVSDEESEIQLSKVLLAVARNLLPPFFLIFIVLGSIFAGVATPTEAAGVGAFGAILLALGRRRLNFRLLNDVVRESGATIAMIFLVVIGATVFAYVFRALGGDFIVTDLVRSLGFGSWGLLFILLFIVFILGFFFDWIEIVLIVVPIFGPLIATMEFGDHIARRDVIYWFAVLIAINLQTSFLTPPFGFALFFLKGVAPPSIQLAHIYRGIIPFVLLQLTGLGFVIAFPWLVLWLPDQMLR